MTAWPRASARKRGSLRLAALWWTLGWVLLLLVVSGCLEPPRYVPNVHVSDKVEHATAYFLLTFWFGGLLARRSYPALAIAMLVLGALIEVAQGLMGWGRTADIRDFAADSLGVAIGLAFIYAGLGSWMAQVERRFGLSRELA
jgi:VanZ family protein